MKVVTSGLRFLDIDAYAGCVAYAELLRLQGHEAIAFSSATMNDSIPKTLRGLPVEFSASYVPSNQDTFVLVDVSEPDFIEKTVDITRVEEVIDHHLGYEDYWRAKLGNYAQLEFIGAACTQIVERWVAAKKLQQMSHESAYLLIAGILDNTLNFKARITHERDIAAYQLLAQHVDMSPDWPASYFMECQATITNDVRAALRLDTKIMSFTQLSVGPIAVGQLVVWDASILIREYRTVLEETLVSMDENWFLNIVSISEGASYFSASNETIKRWAETILGASFTKSFCQADRLWLRKEIVQRDYEGAGRSPAAQ